ncbi:MAG: sigma-54 dependent transcriptional regulator [candidate division KSB1 bacterium]|nr:sigma-54 dependent transcriptional regulator [candidate division KSB1 bacterium]MDZ7295561.1 sigma-54 dependent transcriptional regulator [candidate division KSB1 bacterium]MDZ7385368.1 sigma-54 dependent transcriptional regulator [candidate division KSB1 bacterium]MDZ7393500.1 sigma-54 dependent transcriptional regulator [candidate division KSB1 bacterium]MDZ7413046.1 sigma-54 dependent transcriptional regulator [candidate division KSB1 bacterium]
MRKGPAAHILVVDDDPKLLAIVEDILIHEGYRVSVAASAAEALRLAGQEDPDLILLDLYMPGVDGTDLLRQLAAMDSARPIIVISAYGDIPKAVESIQHGASNFLEKPLQLPVLLHHVEEQLRRGEALRKTAASAAQYYERYGMIGTSQQMRIVYSLIDRVAPSDATVLIVGETGTGKELAANAIHRLSRRAHGRFVVVNCSAFPETLLESQLFGHKKGAFTGAVRDYDGLFVYANGGTLFLDEISSMSAGAQAKVLRALETGDVQPVGSESVRQVDVRVLVASNRNLEEEVRAGRFREDLFYRLNVVRIQLPPLRERKEDIPLLVDHFVGQFCTELHKPKLHFTPAAMRAMVGAYWSGNVRELRNFLERLVLLADGDVVDISQVLRALGSDQENGGLGYVGLSLREARRKFERDLIRATLIANGWSINAAARELGIERTNLYRKMRQLGIDQEFHGEQSM